MRAGIVQAELRRSGLNEPQSLFSGSKRKRDEITKSSVSLSSGLIYSSYLKLAINTEYFSSNVFFLIREIWI